MQTFVDDFNLHRKRLILQGQALQTLRIRSEAIVTDDSRVSHRPQSLGMHTTGAIIYYEVAICQSVDNCSLRHLNRVPATTPSASSVTLKAGREAKRKHQGRNIRRDKDISICSLPCTVFARADRCSYLLDLSLVRRQS